MFAARMFVVYGGVRLVCLCASSVTVVECGEAWISASRESGGPSCGPAIAVEFSANHRDEGRVPRFGGSRLAVCCIHDRLPDAGGRMNGKSRRGFASMDPARQREIASRGGRAAHKKGTAHQWSADEAREAGRKGGVAVSRDRSHMAAIGRGGGESRGEAVRRARAAQGAEREVPVEVQKDTGRPSGTPRPLRSVEQTDRVSGGDQRPEAG